MVMKELILEINDYAAQKYPCIFLGDTGVGKEFAALKYYEIIKEHNHLTGHFISHNCAGLSNEMAVSELFGHKKGAFTGATQNKDGLFKEAKGGVLFLDEIGELSGEVQAMLLRAVDLGIQEARPLGGDKNDTYSTADILILTATDKPFKIQEPLLNRLGAQLEIPSLDDRKEDVPGAIYFNTQYALAKRIDRTNVINKIFRTEIDNLNINNSAFVNLDEVKTIAKLASEKLSLIVWERSWPGNFRALRIAIDTSIIRAKSFESPESFVADIEKYFVQNLDKYSKPQNSIKSTLPQSININSDLNSEYHQKINEAMPRIEPIEKRRIALFLTENEDSVFTRLDFEKAIKLKTRTAQNRIKQLILSDIIEAEGKRNDCFKLVKAEKAELFQSNDLSFLSLPPDLPFLEGRNNEVSEVLELIPNVKALYISGRKGIGKTLFLQTIASKLATKMPVFFYPIGLKGIRNLISILTCELSKRGIANLNETLSNNPDIKLLIASMSGYMEQLLGKDPSPLLFIDNLPDYNHSFDIEVINAMMLFWPDIKFVLAGNKLSNVYQFENNNLVTEYHLS